MTSKPVPTGLIPIALVLLLWHGVLGADYVVDHFHLGAPEWPGIARLLPLDALWLQVVWAMCVWLGFGAAFFLLIRDNASVLLFFATAVAALVVAAGTYLAIGTAISVLQYVLLGALFILPVFGWIFSRALNQNGQLT